MEKEKKKWEIPKLICLYRGRPEEAVLLLCKSTQGVDGPRKKCNNPALNCQNGGIPSSSLSLLDFWLSLRR